jgi:hypothetical protein
MGCFGSASSKQADSNDSDDSKSQKRRSDAITKQLQRDKQVRKNRKISFSIFIQKKDKLIQMQIHARAKLLIDRMKMENTLTSLLYTFN